MRRVKDFDDCFIELMADFDDDSAAINVGLLGSKWPRTFSEKLGILSSSTSLTSSCCLRLSFTNCNIVITWLVILRVFMSSICCSNNLFLFAYTPEHKHKVQPTITN
jgi:hypothetical protein